MDVRSDPYFNVFLPKREGRLRPVIYYVVWSGQQCPLGHSCPYGSTEPAICPPGTYQSQPAQASCQTCPTGDSMLRYIRNIYTPIDSVLKICPVLLQVFTVWKVHLLLRPAQLEQWVKLKDCSLCWTAPPAPQAFTAILVLSPLPQDLVLLVSVSWC